ncbi:MAG: arsenical pump-driving ATPase, partial [Parvibaculum sedimenti]
VINRSLAAAATHDPLLRARIAAERIQIERVGKTLARRLFLLPWQAEPPVGVSALSELVSG